MNNISPEFIYGLVGAIAGALSALISLYAIFQALRFRTESSTSEKLANLPEYLSKQYVDRVFEIRDKRGRRRSLTLREARLLAKSDISPKRGETISDARNRFIAATLEIGSWQNRFAYEVSIGLEWVGIMILNGAIPFSIVVTLVGMLIIEDWTYCKELVAKVIRAQEPVTPKNNRFGPFVAYQRRHAEWLAYASAIYMCNYWTSQHLDDLLYLLGNFTSIKSAERAIRKFERPFIPPSTRRELFHLLSKF